jgi:uncharacterized spore protein YtfJ
MSSVDRMFDTFDELKKSAQVNAVFGQPQIVGDRTIIPIARVSYGFGLGFGEDTTPGEEEQTDEGAGGGGWAAARPVGALVVTPDGTRVEPVIDKGRIALAAGAFTAWTVFLITRALIKILNRR